MDVEHADDAASRIAAAIGEPARARMLYGLMDNHARTGTELAVVAGVSTSTASAHLHRLKTERLVKVLVQGKHRYYSLAGSDVAGVLEGLSVLAGGVRDKFVPNTPHRLRAARTCYDHMAGTLAYCCTIGSTQWNGCPRVRRATIHTASPQKERRYFRVWAST